MHINLILGKDLQSLLVDPSGKVLIVNNGTLTIPASNKIIHYPELCLHPQKTHLNLFGKIRKLRNFDLVILSNSKEIFDYLLHIIPYTSSNQKSIFFNATLTIKVISDDNQQFIYSESLDDFGLEHKFPVDFWSIDTNKYRF